MEEIRKFEFIGKSLYFPEEKILVLADLHIGYEEYLNKKGVFLPRLQFKEMMDELEKLFRKIEKNNKNKKINEIEVINKNKKINEIIVLGDLKHEFGKISSQEWREVVGVLNFFKRKAKKIVLIKGNHDTILGPIAEREEVKIKKYYISDEICFLHGNNLFPECLDKKIKMLVIGHRHPAVSLTDKYKKEKYKCFLVGKWKNKKVIILPSFFPFIEGSDIANNYGENKLFIPEKSLRSFDVYVVGDKVYRFGKLKGII